MTVPVDKLVRMAEQIAANISASEDPQIVADAVLTHIKRFWDPRMLDTFVGQANRDELSPILQRAHSSLASDRKI